MKDLSSLPKKYPLATLRKIFSTFATDDEKRREAEATDLNKRFKIKVDVARRTPEGKIASLQSSLECEENKGDQREEVN